MGADAYLVALTRISGIVGGVFVMLLLSVIIFPKSASHQVRHMSKRAHGYRRLSIVGLDMEVPLLAACLSILGVA